MGKHVFCYRRTTLRNSLPYKSIRASILVMQHFRLLYAFFNHFILQVHRFLAETLPTIRFQCCENVIRYLRQATGLLIIPLLFFGSPVAQRRYWSIFSQFVSQFFFELNKARMKVTCSFAVTYDITFPDLLLPFPPLKGDRKVVKQCQFFQG